MPDEPHPSPPTLPDLLREGLDVVFVGINPSVYSATQGHYFARRTNRFWPAFSRSRLSEGARQALGVNRIEPAQDRLLLDYGFGFTDVVKRPSARAAELSPTEFIAGAKTLAKKLERCQPRLACFHGLMGFRPFHRALALSSEDPRLGLQTPLIGRTRIFVVPNPSPANAHFTPADQTRWYDALAGVLDEGPRNP
jgi:TDG/mug DNA glycosylase family protein